MTWLVHLDEIGEGDGLRVGGKALALAALHRNGHAVPRTWCLSSAAYDLFVEQSALRSVLHQELGRKSFEQMRWEEIWDTALRIRNRFLRAPIPSEIVAAIEAHLSGELSERALAVRSSAPGEDSKSASFAGLHDSYVDVRGIAATLEAIRRVWASLWTDRALLYRRELGIDVERSTMAVLIQELVDGEVSGIAFGVHPSDPDLGVIESVYGLNQGLVDGTIEPDRWIIDRQTGRIAAHTPPGERRRLVARSSQTVVEEVPEGQRSVPPLTKMSVAEVFTAARAAEALFGGPQDVEWTFSAGRLVLLQSRPITTSTSDDGDKRAWYLSLTRSLDNLRGLRTRVEDELLPAMDREAEALAKHDLSGLDDDQLVSEIERRHAVHNRWVDVYWKEFIPFAHGIRLFGQFYNDTMRPEDPYEFMELLAGTSLLSVRRNGELSRIAAQVRSSPALRTQLESGQIRDPKLAQEFETFEREFGDAVYADQACFHDRAQLARLILALAGDPSVAEPASGPGVEDRAESFLAQVGPDRKDLARELLDLGRVSYQLRDDDNIHLARLEALVLAGVEEGRRRLDQRHDRDHAWMELEDVLRGLRNPNLVVEPRPQEKAPAVEPGFRARPRQLVGQPAGPGVAVGQARVIESVDDLFEFKAGEVLVCDAVDPNMTFVVPLAKAVVERRGGMLIHGAIIAREYGLPCVTGIPDATTLISTGDHLTVDGYLGIVTVS